MGHLVGDCAVEHQQEEEWAQSRTVVNPLLLYPPSPHMGSYIHFRVFMHVFYDRDYLNILEPFFFLEYCAG